LSGDISCWNVAGKTDERTSIIRTVCVVERLLALIGLIGFGRGGIENGTGLGLPLATLVKSACLFDPVNLSRPDRGGVCACASGNFTEEDTEEEL
jgi:hypothetical protein